MRKRDRDRWRIAQEKRVLKEWSEMAEYEAEKESAWWHRMVEAVRTLRENGVK